MSNRMQQRDYYLRDYSKKYWPTCTFQDFTHILSMPASWKYILLRDTQRLSFRKTEQSNQNIVIGSFTTAITLSLFYRMIPGLNATTRTTRVLITMGMFIGVVVVDSVLTKEKAKRLDGMFKQKERGWRAWKDTGDWLRVNPDLKLEELPVEREEKVGGKGVGKGKLQGKAG